MCLYLDFSVNSCFQWQLPHRCGMYVHVHRDLPPCICSSHQGVGQSSLVSCFPSPSPSPAGTHLGASSQLPAPFAPHPPISPPPSQAAYLTIWLLFFQSRCKGLHQRPGTSLIPPTLLLLWPGFYCSYRLYGDVQEGGNNVDHMYMKPSTTHLAAGSWTPSSRF